MSPIEAIKILFTSLKMDVVTQTLIENENRNTTLQTLHDRYKMKVDNILQLETDIKPKLEDALGPKFTRLDEREKTVLVKIANEIADVMNFAKAPYIDVLSANCRDAVKSLCNHMDDFCHYTWKGSVPYIQSFGNLWTISLALYFTARVVEVGRHDDRKRILTSKKLNDNKFDNIKPDMTDTSSIDVDRQVFMSFTVGQFYNFEIPTFCLPTREISVWVESVWASRFAVTFLVPICVFSGFQIHQEELKDIEGEGGKSASKRPDFILVNNPEVEVAQISEMAPQLTLEMKLGSGKETLRDNVYLQVLANMAVTATKVAFVISEEDIYKVEYKGINKQEKKVRLASHKYNHNTNAAGCLLYELHKKENYGINTEDHEELKNFILKDPEASSATSGSAPKSGGTESSNESKRKRKDVEKERNVGSYVDQRQTDSSNKQSKRGRGNQGTKGKVKKVEQFFSRFGERLKKSKVREGEALDEDSPRNGVDSNFPPAATSDYENVSNRSLNPFHWRQWRGSQSLPLPPANSPQRG
ncbi:hypothetical protein KGF57_003596 [Candida theae]|uniref:Uncharacterized protein n=1 Tax=Candida theae TaxID=1198502 RepID=A0AAD5BD26_9ASCO|nr:uncharacterized protein KGF57_003596 [Candida theae]KAI5955464.1 hypothetical protein KGF57_003596 [Candida theae]